MSSLAALASKSSSDEQLLSSINDALLQLQLEAAGKAADLGYKKEDLELSRKISTGAGCGKNPVATR